MAPMDLASFCVKLPKIELHAHINGSISPSTMHQLVARKKHVKPELANFQIPESLDRIDDFFSLFKFIYQLTDDEEGVRLTTRNVIDEFAKDGVKYLELRTTPRKCDETGMTKRSYLAAVLSAINEPRSDIIVRLIVSIDRRNTLQEAEEAVDLALEFRSQGVVGIDLCGHVKQGLFEALKPAFERAQANNFKITLHFNEVEENIAEAPSLLSIQPNRLGHATLLDDYSRNQIYKHAIPVEICMTSNVLCKTVATFKDHHVKDLLLQKHPFIICTDDKGVFFSDLSNEYAICAKTFSMTYQQLYDASFQSIDAIFSDDAMKDLLKQQWKTWHEEHLDYFK